MKILILVVVPLFVFGATLLGVLAATGHLNQEAFQRIRGKEVVKEAQDGEKKVTADSLGALAEQLKQREASIAAKEKELAENETRLEARKKGLDQQTAELKTLMQQIDGNLAQAEQDRQAKIKAQALSVANMEAESAAKALESLPTQDAAAILLDVKDKQRGEILNTMTPEKAASILKALQEVTRPSAQPSKTPPSAAGEKTPAQRGG